MTESQLEKAKGFLALHQNSGCFLMPNAWDAGSAKMLVASGFKAIGTTSAGIAFALGRPDNIFCSPVARVNRDVMLPAISAIANAVTVPVNADLESGYAETPEELAGTIKLVIRGGAVGGNIEDYTGSKEQPLLELSSAIERIKVVRQTIDASGVPFVLVARTDRLNIGRSDGFAEAVERANCYREAGADCLFVPGVSDIRTVSELVREINGPLNVVMGLSGGDVSFSQLQDVGVRRVSIGGSLARATYYQIRKAAEEMIGHGSFTFADEQIPQDELNNIFESDL